MALSLIRVHPSFKRHFKVRPQASNRQHPGPTSPPPLYSPCLPPFSPWFKENLSAPMRCLSWFLVLLWIFDVFLRLFATSGSPRRKTWWGTWYSICYVPGIQFVCFFLSKLMHDSHNNAVHMPLRKFVLRWEFKTIRVSTSNFTRICLFEASIFFFPLARADLHRRLPWEEESTPSVRSHGGCLATLFTPLFPSLFFSLYLSPPISVPLSLEAPRTIQNIPDLQNTRGIVLLLTYTLKKQRRFRIFKAVF